MLFVSKTYRQQPSKKRLMNLSTQKFKFSSDNNHQKQMEEKNNHKYHLIDDRLIFLINKPFLHIKIKINIPTEK